MAEATGIMLLNAEDNSESGLTITEEGSNNFSIATGAALHGSYGYNFAFSGNSGENLLYFTKQFTAGSDIYARCYFYIPSSFSSSTSYLSILSIMRSDGVANYTVYARLYNASGAIKFDRLAYIDNTGGSYISLNTSVSRDTLHYMELRFKAGNGDGLVECWLDGTKIGEVTGLTNNNYQSGYIRAGNAREAVPTSGSVFYIDDIKVDSSYIGAYADSGGSSHVLGIMQAMNQFNGGL